MPVAIAVLAMMVAFVGTTVETSRASVADMDSFRARAAAENAAALAATKIWGDFSRATADAGELWRFRTHLDGLGLVDQGTSGANADRKDMLESMGLARDARDRDSVDGAEIERLDVYRVDDWDATTIVIEVDAVVRGGQDGSHAEKRSSIQEVFVVAPPNWEGLDFAMLANNINCLLCHTTIDNAERVYNNNTTLAGTFDAVKIGSIDSIHFRADPDSKIAGRALIGGDAIEGDGSEITNWDNFNLKTAKLADEMIVEDGFLNADWEQLQLFNPDDPHSADTASVWLDFYQHGDNSDENLPTSFPSPYPDSGGLDPVTGQPVSANAGNRIVDDSEFFAKTQGAVGSISGGAISVVGQGGRIDSAGELASLLIGKETGLASHTDGSAVLIGTEANPIILDGEVAIDGDVVLSGYVIGTGSIMARGNVYVPGDLKYLDGQTNGYRTYGTAANGSTNSLAVAAGGNIVVGDFYRPAWGEGNVETGEPGSSFNFTMDELAIFNRQEWMKTQPTLPGKANYEQTGVKVSLKDKKVKVPYQKTVNTWKWVVTGTKKVQKWKWVKTTTGVAPYQTTTKKKVPNGFKTVKTKKKVKTGTKKVTKYKWVKTGEKIEVETPIMGWVTPQVENPYHVPQYLPRYYSFAEGTKVPIFNKHGYFDPETAHWKSEERPGGWSGGALSLADVDNGQDPYLYDGSGKPIAVVSTVAPTADWMRASEMQSLIETLQARSASDKTIEIDATLYSANSILGTVPSRESQYTNGKLIVNGSIVAADVGILAPGGTQVNYDARGARALSITSEAGIEMRRSFVAPLPHM
ncbi:MAG: hypothetical protein AAFR54_04195 [Planctomycetota bacterium]